MNLNLNGKRAIVCGSTQGIGQACAAELALLGASITLIARNEDKLKTVMNELEATRRRRSMITSWQIFHSRMISERKVNEYILKNSISILVNNTGGPPAGLAIDAGLNEYCKRFHQSFIVQPHFSEGCGARHEA